MTLDNYSWGYRRNINNVDVLPITDLISIFTATVRYVVITDQEKTGTYLKNKALLLLFSCGGNFLLNVSVWKFCQITVSMAFNDCLCDSLSQHIYLYNVV